MILYNELFTRAVDLKRLAQDPERMEKYGWRLKYEDAKTAYGWYLEEAQLLRPHDRLVFGACTMTGGIKPVRHDVKRPITWEILHKEGARMLLVSEYCLDWEFYDGNCPFLGPAAQTTWEKCTIRDDLNGAFFESAFTDEEKAMILTTDVHTEDEPAFGTRGGADTRDKIFLLSATEVLRYYGEDGDTRRSRTAMVGASVDKDSVELYGYMHEWWLRTPGESQDKVAYVNWQGYIIREGMSSDADEVGIRPAMWIDLSLFSPEPDQELEMPQTGYLS